MVYFILFEKKEKKKGWHDSNWQSFCKVKKVEINNKQVKSTTHKSIVSNSQVKQVLKHDLKNGNNIMCIMF